MSSFQYGKCSEILKLFLFLLSNKMQVIRAGIHKMLVRKANREDPGRTARSSLIWVCTVLYRPFWQENIVLEIFRT